jgi:hypothetical protein
MRASRIVMPGSQPGGNDKTSKEFFAKVVLIGVSETTQTLEVSGLSLCCSEMSAGIIRLLKAVRNGPSPAERHGKLTKVRDIAITEKDDAIALIVYPQSMSYVLGSEPWIDESSVRNRQHRSATGESEEICAPNPISCCNWVLCATDLHSLTIPLACKSHRISLLAVETPDAIRAVSEEVWARNSFG